MLTVANDVATSAIGIGTLLAWFSNSSKSLSTAEGAAATNICASVPRSNAQAAAICTLFSVADPEKLLFIRFMNVCNERIETNHSFQIDCQYLLYA
mmetsp:Transcript_12821/g.20882  ORF Transcript_12821/g.20882 Transcript_12821/m.20882 type:complete len:96 (-) Transcript_12821:299-586(-)